MTIDILTYTPEHAEQWNLFCREAKNGLFIFDRNFMDYHSDRFEDDSALVFSDNKLIAIFPAARDDKETVTSHSGLTFGGPILHSRVRAETTIAIVRALIIHYKKSGTLRLTVKPVPHSFANYPSGDIEYALWRNGFSITQRNLSSILPLNNSLPFNSSKKSGVRAATKAGVTIQSEGLAQFHSLLSGVLESNHDVGPAHSISELELLKLQFPENIVLKAAYVDHKIVAGALIFKYGQVWHTQYLASSDVGRKVGGLDFVISSLVEEARQTDCKFVSFGVSTTHGGKELNKGLVWQKESFGARGITHDVLTLDIE